MKIPPGQEETVRAYFQARTRFELAGGTVESGDSLPRLENLTSAAAIDAITAYGAAMRRLQEPEGRVAAFLREDGPFDRTAFAEAADCLRAAAEQLERLARLTEEARR